MGFSIVMTISPRSSSMFFNSIERSTTVRSMGVVSMMTNKNAQSGASLPTSILALSLEASQIFWEGAESDIVEVDEMIIPEKSVDVSATDSTTVREAKDGHGVRCDDDGSWRK